MSRVIAIDGPSGAGKSSVSRLVAMRLGYQYLDTGALYRALALYLTRNGVIAEASDATIVNAVKDATIKLEGEKVLLNGEDVTDIIRTPEAGHFASVFSARKSVREYLLEMQKTAGRSSNIVAEGRDMTTVVFPDAMVKIYLDASEHGRAQRRYVQLNEKGMSITMEDALKDVQERDFRDKNRDIAPLKRADEAVYIDSTNMSIEEVVDHIIQMAK
ncbi:MAG TPA: (d)CMP kinase [Dissulfurispiraceae bacterium]|nr:(d)CMP kinase [Dissulfurispiraceae bacterium]